MDKTRKKTFVFSLLVVVGMLLPTNLCAQEQKGRPGGLLGSERNVENYSFLGRGGSLFSWAIDEEDFGSTPEGDINVEDFGTPLGSGIVVLLVTGAGYATLKSKKQNETNKNKENKQ